jgi:hypothetical protein
MFCLVLFEDESVEVVPISWFESDSIVVNQTNSLAFPPEKSNLRKLVSSISHPLNTWETFQVKVLYQNGK